MGVSDLQEPLTAWAKSHLGVLDQELESGETKLDIDTTKIRMKTSDPVFKETIVDGNGSPSGIVFQSKYVNNTAAHQEHTFIMERMTEATVTTVLTKGFSRNGTVGIKLDVPQAIANVTGGFGSDVTVETEDESTVKHSVKWAINSKVSAPPNKTTVAVLRINERRSDFTFTTNVTLKGRVLAKVVDVATGRVRKLVEGDLATILNEKKYNGGFSPNRRDVQIDLETRKVTWGVAGSLKFRFGVSQDVQVAYE